MAQRGVAQRGVIHAHGLVVDLSAEVLGAPVISADARIGNAAVPASGGRDASTQVPISLSGAVGVTASGMVERVSANSQLLLASDAFSSVTGLRLGVLGIDVLDAVAVTSSAVCPVFGGGMNANVEITGLRLFGTAVTLGRFGPPVTDSAPVTVPGLLGATLNVTLTRAGRVQADATAIPVLATFTLTGTIDGEPVTIPAGTVTVAESHCEIPPIPIPPRISAITPDSGPQSGGQTVTITGANFLPGQTLVSFGGVRVPGNVAPGGTSLTAVTPANPAGPVRVSVSTLVGSTPTSLDYTYLADGSGATVTDLTPPTGPTSGGTTVTITGTGLTGAIGVDFDGLPATGFTVNPAGTTITVVTPTNAAGPADLSLVFPAGTADAGTFTYLAPAITSVSPPSGPATGGTTVTITGTGFTRATGPAEVTLARTTHPVRATEVTFDGIPGTSLVVDPSGTSLTVVTPPGAPGPVDVIVRLPGADAVATDAFRYVGQELPVTGRSTSGLVKYSAGAIVIGVLLLLLARRRHGDHLLG